VYSSKKNTAPGRVDACQSPPPRRAPKRRPNAQKTPRCASRRCPEHTKSHRRRRPPEMEPREAENRPAGGDRAAAAGAKTPPKRSNNAALRVPTVPRTHKEPPPSTTARNGARGRRTWTLRRRPRRRGGRQNAAQTLKKRRAARAGGAQNTQGAAPDADRPEGSPGTPCMDPPAATAPPRRAPKRRPNSQKTPRCARRRTPKPPGADRPLPQPYGGRVEATAPRWRKRGSDCRGRLAAHGKTNGNADRPGVDVGGWGVQ